MAFAASAAIGVAQEPARSIGQDVSPLDRLKNRSASDRWQKFRDNRSQPEPSTFDRTATENGERKPIPRGFGSPNSPPVSVPVSENYDFPQYGNTLSIAASQPDIEAYPDPVRDPAKLKKLSSILPYFDYEPGGRGRDKGPCANLCPRPDGKPCQIDADGRTPACPEEVSLSAGMYEGRQFSDTVFQWEASNLYHFPLYFEDPTIERYGHTHHDAIQPFVSTARFGVQLLGLPYQMTIDPIVKKMYTLGYYRPGECAPKKYYQIPWNTEAAIRQAAVTTGLFYIFP